jgi:hypothetical protein
MALYALTEKGKVVECPYNCSKNHEHYQGTFENALKYFGVDEVKGWGKLMNIIVYHQTSGMTVPKLTNELLDILVKAQKERKYWSNPEEREQMALDAIANAERIGLISDERLLDMLRNSERDAAKSRIWAYEKWMSSR